MKRYLSTLAVFVMIMICCTPSFGEVLSGSSGWGDHVQIKISHWAIRELGVTSVGTQYNGNWSSTYDLYISVAGGIRKEMEIYRKDKDTLSASFYETNLQGQCQRIKCISNKGVGYNARPLPAAGAPGEIDFRALGPWNQAIIRYTPK